MSGRKGRGVPIKTRQRLALPLALKEAAERTTRFVFASILDPRTALLDPTGNSCTCVRAIARRRVESTSDATRIFLMGTYVVRRSTARRTLVNFVRPNLNL